MDCVWCVWLVVIVCWWSCVLVGVCVGWVWICVGVVGGRWFGWVCVCGIGVCCWWLFGVGYVCWCVVCVDVYVVVLVGGSWIELLVIVWWSVVLWCEVVVCCVGFWFENDCWVVVIYWFGEFYVCVLVLGWVDVECVLGSGCGSGMCMMCVVC